MAAGWGCCGNVWHRMAATAIRKPAVGGSIVRDIRNQQKAERAFYQRDWK